MRRYRAVSEDEKAELIEGIVYTTHLVSTGNHAAQHSDLCGWLGYYRSKTPGLLCANDSTLLLDEENVPQPDLLLSIPHDVGGRAVLNDDDYLEGAPELVIEIAASSKSIDLNAKLRAYRRNRILEYIVWRTYDREIDWFDWIDGEYVRQEPQCIDGRRVLKSRTFPGLWLDVQAALEGDLATLFAAVDRGVRDSPGHADLLARLRG